MCFVIVNCRLPSTIDRRLPTIYRGKRKKNKIMNNDAKLINGKK